MEPQAEQEADRIVLKRGGSPAFMPGSSQALAESPLFEYSTEQRK